MVNLLNEINHSIGKFYSPLPLWVFIISIICGVLLLVAFVPGWINTLRNKDTSSLSIGMWILSICGVICLCIFFALGIAVTKESTGTPSVQFSFLLACESVCLLTSVHILVLKIKNKLSAKKLNISEREYCLRLKTKKKWG